MSFCRAPYLRQHVRQPAAIVLIGFIGMVSTVAYAQTPATGLRARATPADYAVSQPSPHATFAASLLSADQVKHLFSIDIGKTYLVFEVACYPSPSGDVALNPSDFLVKSASPAEYIHPSDAATIASLLQDKNTPSVPRRGPEVVTTATVGYETGTDPYTGRRVHDVYTAGSVGVSNAPDNLPPAPPRRGSSPQDRVTLENQLADKSLPQGTFRTPVAGYLYFAADALKKSNGNYDLQYLSDDSGKVDLVVPSKRK